METPAIIPWIPRIGAAAVGGSVDGLVDGVVDDAGLEGGG